MEYQDLADIRTDFYGVAEHRDTVRKGSKLLNEYLEAGWDLLPPGNDIKNEIDPEEPPCSFEMKNGIGTSDKLIALFDGEELTPERLLSAHNLSPSMWKVVGYKNSFHHSKIQGGDKIILYQSRINVKPYKDDEISFAAIKEWFENYKPTPLKYEKLTKDYGQGDNCLLLPIVDLHYNLLSTKFITGNEYNCKIARDRFLSVVDDVIERTKTVRLKKIIFPIGNDLFNANGINGTTFKGTPQTNEKDIREAYIELFDIVVNAIYKLAQIAPVDVIYIPSNHDKEITFYFLHGLNAQFKFDDDIDVDYSPLPNKYYRFGNTLMMFAHDAKIDKLGNVVLDDAGDLLSGAKYIEVFLSHLHKESVEEDRNIKIRRLPTISGKSTWSNEQNYGCNNVSQSFVINEKVNIYSILYTTIV